MRRHDRCVGLIRSTVVVCAIGFAWSSFALADEPTSSPAPSDQSVQERTVPPVVEGEKAPPEAGDVQERAVRRDQGLPGTQGLIIPPAPGLIPAREGVLARPPSSGNCPPMNRFLANTRSIGCSIDNNHLIQIGNPTGVAIPKGTPLSFTAKLENAGLYCATVPAPSAVPPHLFVTITGQPLFDQQGPCDAWWSPPLLLNPGIQ
jgi:hypothetical protein